MVNASITFRRFRVKPILPFCTHEGSGMGHSEQDIRNLCPGAVVKPGLAIHGGSVQKADDAIAKWIARKS